MEFGTGHKIFTTVSEEELSRQNTLADTKAADLSEGKLSRQDTLVDAQDAPKPVFSRSSTLVDAEDVENTKHAKNAKGSEIAEDAPVQAFSRSNTLVDSEAGYPNDKFVDTTLRAPLWRRAKDAVLSLCVDWWLVEILCWCIGAFCIIVIASILSTWDNKPLPNKFPMGLNLNAYVSVLSAIAKLVLAVPLEEALAAQKYLWFATTTPKHSLLDFERFELAGRRPIGALQLIWKMRIRSWASLGAIIFLLSLGLDPFFQQLVSYPSRASRENLSTTQRVVVFNNDDTMTNLDGSTSTNDEQDWRNVIPTFFKSNSSSEPLQTFCPSETCTWPTFQTLSICSQCEDITSMLTFDCMIESGSWRQVDTIDGPATNLTTGLSCGWFFNASSDQPMLMTGYSLDPQGGVLLSRHLNYHDPAKNDLFWDGSLLAKDIPTPLLNFAAVSSPDIQSVYRNETPDAFSCSMRWCVKEMNASFSHGIYQETEVSRFTNDTLVPDPLECVVSPDDSQEWWYNPNITILPPNSNQTYLIQNRTMLGSIFALGMYIPNSITQKDEATGPQVLFPLFTDEPGVLAETVYNNLWLKKGETPRMVDEFATQLTNALRNDPRHATTVYGSGMYVTFIDVEWAFFSFPLIILGATLALLVVTILQTTKKKVWKASDLTTLVHGLSDEAKEQLKGAGSMREVRAVAKDMHVCLSAFEKGRHLQIEQITSSRA